MRTVKRALFFGLLFTLTLSACASPGTPAATAPDGSTRAAAPKRLTVGLEGMLLNFGSDEKGPAGDGPLMGIVHNGLFEKDTNADPVARLAEALPTQENGLWNVFPDGRMEVTWKIRQDARWHDGEPVTANDLLFNAAIRQDPNIPGFSTSEFLLVETMEATDNRTVLVKFKAPYILAGAMPGFRQLRPSHVLEQAYQSQPPEVFLQHP